MSVEQHQFGTIAMARPQLRLTLLTLDEVAKMLGTSRAWVRDHSTRRIHFLIVEPAAFAVSFAW